MLQTCCWTFILCVWQDVFRWVVQNLCALLSVCLAWKDGVRLEVEVEVGARGWCDVEGDMCMNGREGYRVELG